jgi:ribulose-phosphate 3-epimerase
MTRRPPHISASILNADFARLGDEVARATTGGVDSIHLDVMDGRFVGNISFGAPVVVALRPHSDLPFHTHLMIEGPALRGRLRGAGVI